MNTHRTLIQIRNKKLGLLIFDARKASRRTVEECAEVIGVPPEQFEAFEKGASAPSLPQLELLALFLNVPIDHFWGKQSLSAAAAPEPFQEKERLVLLRNRVIGTNLRLARNNANLSYKEISDKTGVSEDQMKTYELGEAAVPIPELELIARALDLPVEHFYDQHGPLGKWRTQQGSVQRFPC